MNREKLIITPEMLTAGVNVYLRFMLGKSHGITTEADLVSAIYRAMRAKCTDVEERK